MKQTATQIQFWTKLVSAIAIGASSAAPGAGTAATMAAAFSILPACVTVNVNFPESAVQKATDDYVRELYRTKEKGRNGSNPASEPSVSPSGPKASRLELLIDGVLPSAWADADAVFKVDTDKALKIRERLASRVQDVIEQKRAGVLGESNDGMLVLKAPDKLKKLLVKKVEKLVTDENKDREDLYNEVVAANGLNKARIKDVQKSFARSFQAESPSGAWLQDSDGKWAQKP